MRTWPRPTIPVLPGRGRPVMVHDTGSGGPRPAAADGRCGLYVCGITPYDATHLGHAATYLAFDLLVRALLDARVQVRLASNVTDVDDPLLERAAATGVDWRVLAAEQTAQFAHDMAALAVVPPDVWTTAVEAVPAVVDAVGRMLAEGSAYVVGRPDAAGAGERDVYADVTADARFGAGTGLDRDAMLALAAERGGDPGRAGKRDPLDPLLWRAARDGEPSWPGGDLGPGRPGWHVECTVIARDGLGLPFDVLGGGSDLVFPHHTCSASHARALGAAGCGRVGVHTGMVGWQGEKMSKSLGNLVLVRDLLDAGIDPMAVRLAVLAHHYRSDWEWTEQGLRDAEQRLRRWRAAAVTGADATGLLGELRAALADDLDAPRALAAVDAWAGRVLAGGLAEAAEGEADLAARAVGALLGVRLEPASG